MVNEPRKIFLSQTTNFTGIFEETDVHFRVNTECNISWEMEGDITRLSVATIETAEGYMVEIRIPLVERAFDGRALGIDFQVNYARDGERRGVVT